MTTPALALNSLQTLANETAEDLCVVHGPWDRFKLFMLGVDDDYSELTKFPEWGWIGVIIDGLELDGNLNTTKEFATIVAIFPDSTVKMQRSYYTGSRPRPTWGEWQDLDVPILELAYVPEIMTELNLSVVGL